MSGKKQQYSAESGVIYSPVKSTEIPQGFI